jgi:phosphatidylserine/phosphatidylglycerophosphate/cardiolipin synthase-like enzyme
VLRPILAAEHPGRSGFRILAAGLDVLLARIQMIDAAQRALGIQYFFAALRASRSSIGSAGLGRVVIAPPEPAPARR